MHVANVLARPTNSFFCIFVFLVLVFVICDFAPTAFYWRDWICLGNDFKLLQL
jgi:hypothetical protein